VQHLLVVDNAEELRLSALLEEEAAKREKTVRNYRRDMEKLHLECMAYKQLVEKLKKELDDERTKYASHIAMSVIRDLLRRVRTHLMDECGPQTASSAADGDADHSEQHLSGHLLIGGVPQRARSVCTFVASS
jgi:hypothetical protein